MLRRFKMLVPPLIVLGLIAANIGVYQAHAHTWGVLHWNKGGSVIYMYQSWGGGAHYAEADAARSNAYYTIYHLYNYWQSVHTDVTVWDANSGATGWGGLANVWYSYDHITHGHAQVNDYYGYSGTSAQGVFCQEDFHTYGFLHDNTGGCMGLGYFAGQTYTLNSHNNDDFDNSYLYHTVH